MQKCWTLSSDKRPTFSELWKALDVFVSESDDGSSYLALEEPDSIFEKLDRDMLKCLSEVAQGDLEVVESHL